MITLTDRARDKILELLRSEGREGLAVRIAIDGRGPVGWRYRLGFVGPEERRPDDALVDAGGFQMFVDAASVVEVTGASIDYVEGLMENGFKIENPNTPWKDPVAAKVARILEDEINPAVAMHGGTIALLDVKDGVVYLSLGGGCQGCGMASVTLRQGIEVRLREAVPEIREVVDATDHGAGESPYYSSPEGGESPLR